MRGGGWITRGERRRSIIREKRGDELVWGKSEGRA